MRNYAAYYFLLTSFLIFGCQPSQIEGDIEQWKAEIVAVEKAFNDMAASDGIDKAFEFYAAEDAVIKRNQEIIKGKAAIAERIKSSTRPNEILQWSPTFVDVSQSGDLAYTYGDFTFTFQDSLGMNQTAKGVFHTVWKRQDDGSWRYVWD